MKKAFIMIFFLLATIIVTQAATINKKNNRTTTSIEKKSSKLLLPPQGHWIFLAIVEHCSNGTNFSTLIATWIPDDVTENIYSVTTYDGVECPPPQPPAQP